MVICDECHHVSAFSFEKVMRAVKARYVHGLTGTPKRSDGLQAIAFMQCGPVRYQAGKGVAGEEAPLARVMVPRFTKTRLDDVDQENFTQLVDGLCADEARNGLIVRDVARAVSYTHLRTRGRAPRACRAGPAPSGRRPPWRATRATKIGRAHV